jgi:hypothetical protein
MAISGHESAAAKTMSWLTPPGILEALGEFDLDPCTPEVMPWKTAHRRFTEKEDGLVQPWHGRVWLNPPYGRQVHSWIEKMAQHGNGIALTFARTDTAFWFKSIWPRAQAILFLKGRLHFHHEDGRRAKANAGAPSVLIAYGGENADVLRCSGIEGVFVALRFVNPEDIQHAF